MKKIFNFVLLLFVVQLLIPACFAFDFDSIKQKTVKAVGNVEPISTVQNVTNIKQRKAEKIFKDKITSDDFRLKYHVIMLQFDKEGYNDGEKSLYGILVSYLDGKESVVSSLNFDYAIKAKSLFDKILTYTPDNCPTAKEFDKQKIFVSDNDFDKLDDNIIKVITALNVY